MSSCLDFCICEPTFDHTQPMSLHDVTIVTIKSLQVVLPWLTMTVFENIKRLLRFLDVGLNNQPPALLNHPTTWLKQQYIIPHTDWCFYIHSLGSCWHAPLPRSLSPWRLESGSEAATQRLVLTITGAPPTFPPTDYSNNPGCWWWLSHSYCALCLSGCLEITSNGRLTVNVVGEIW